MTSIAFMGLVFLVGAAFTFPEQTRARMAIAGNYFQRLIEKWMPASVTGAGVDREEQQANFTALEGTVKVKKHNRNTWTDANFNIPLEKGDVVQTGSDGIAKVVFADGTNYVVKQDSLIVVEEYSTNLAPQTSVALQVTTGTVDLATAQYTDGSSSKVIVAGATAKFSPETAAQVHNDPHADKHD